MYFLRYTKKYVHRMEEIKNEIYEKNLYHAIKPKDQQCQVYRSIFMNILQSKVAQFGGVTEEQSFLTS